VSNIFSAFTKQLCEPKEAERLRYECESFDSALLVWTIEQVLERGYCVYLAEERTDILRGEWHIPDLSFGAHGVVHGHKYVILVFEGVTSELGTLAAAIHELGHTVIGCPDDQLSIERWGAIGSPAREAAAWVLGIELFKNQFVEGAAPLLSRLWERAAEAVRAYSIQS